jgi:hypothetical protein
MSANKKTKSDTAARQVSAAGAARSARGAGAASPALRSARAVALAENLRRGEHGHRSGRAAPREARRLPRPELLGLDFVQDLSEGAVELARASLERRIRAHLSRGALAVTLTDNRYTMISVRRESREGPLYKVRLHHMFADADPRITRALARYIARNDREASRLLGDYIDSNQHRVRSRGRRAAAPVLVTRGDVHDLQPIFDDLNERYFDGRIVATLTWGPRTGRPRRRNSIKMGSYSVEDRLIRIHRSLDRAFVPRFFVEWIVYHEMLHQVHPIRVVNGRRQFHTKAFLEDEARFEHYAAARAWERAHLDDLLTY